MDDLLKKIDKFRDQNKVDLSVEEDLSIAIMNLISLEEHFFFTAKKTKKCEYFKLLDEVRELRKSLLAKMIPVNEGETWCISKHLLASTMRMIEVGTKYLGAKQEDKAYAMFDEAYKLYNLFWGIRLKLIEMPKSKPAKQSEVWNEDDLVSKLVDCCRE